MPKMKAFCICALALLLIGLLVGGSRARADELAPALLYQQYCSVCHGDRGDGDTHVRQGLNPPPRDFTSAQSIEHLNRDRMLEAVRNGLPNTAMVGWNTRLNDDQIVAVVDYIRDQFMRSTTTHHATGSEHGATLYARNCSVCHGDEGAGATWGQTSLDPPPRNFTSPRSRAELTRERMIAAVTHGRPGTAMVAFKSRLSDEDVEAVVDYIRAGLMRLNAEVAETEIETVASRAGHDHASHGIADMNVPLPNGLHGDFNTGRAFYLQNCATCHGTQGGGDGPRAYFIFPKPRNFQHMATRLAFNRTTLFKAIKDGVPGREMPAWGKVLSDQQIADVSEFVFQEFIHADDGH